jgi:hypothetical protein
MPPGSLFVPPSFWRCAQDCRSSSARLQPATGARGTAIGKPPPYELEHDADKLGLDEDEKEKND